MAKVIFGFDEFLEIAVSNGFLPGPIVRARVKGNRINFVIRTGSFVLPFIPASLKYLRFEDSHAVFELAVVSNRVNKVMSRLNQMFGPEMPAYVKLEYPHLSVDIDGLLTEKNIRGVRVKDIFLENGEFTVITENT